jgi:hypothetical protein
MTMATMTVGKDSLCCSLIVPIEGNERETMKVTLRNGAETSGYYLYGVLSMRRRIGK